MRFHELPVNHKFLMNNIEYVKIPETKASCCKILHNAMEVATGKKIVIKPMDGVEPINGQ